MLRTWSPRSCGENKSRNCLRLGLRAYCICVCSCQRRAVSWGTDVTERRTSGYRVSCSCRRTTHRRNALDSLWVSETSDEVIARRSPSVASCTVVREKTSEPPKHELHSCSISYTVMERRIASNSLRISEQLCGDSRRIPNRLTKETASRFCRMEFGRPCSLHSLGKDPGQGGVAHHHVQRLFAL